VGLEITIGKLVQDHGRDVLPFAKVKEVQRIAAAGGLSAPRPERRMGIPKRSGQDPQPPTLVRRDHRRVQVLRRHQRPGRERELTKRNAVLLRAGDAAVSEVDRVGLLDAAQG